MRRMARIFIYRAYMIMWSSKGYVGLYRYGLDKILSSFGLLEDQVLPTTC